MQSEEADVLTAVVVRYGDSFDVRVVAQEDGDEEAAAAEETADEGPSPIAPELTELAWGAGAFLVLLIAMRLFLFPAVKRGMEARYGKIEDDHAEAETMTSGAKRDVEEYEQALTEVRSEAAQRVDAARQTLERERSARLEEVNERLAARRAEATAELAATREAAQGSIEDAVIDVAGRASELATGRRPADDDLRRVVSDLMSVGASNR